MSNKIEVNGEGHVNKCGGIPWYPAEHYFYEKWLDNVSENRIKNREKRVEKFLKKFLFEESSD